jgi:hypothetical protein
MPKPFAALEVIQPVKGSLARADEPTGEIEVHATVTASLSASETVRASLTEAGKVTATLLTVG